MGNKQPDRIKQCKISLYLIWKIIDTIDENNSALMKLKKNSEDASEILEFKYIAKKQISQDTFIFTYEIPNDYNLGLNLGQHIAIE